MVFAQIRLQRCRLFSLFARFPKFGRLVGKDVAKALGYQNGSRDINRHVDEEDRQNYRNGTSEVNNRGITIINESGLYSLVLSSKLTTASS